MVTRQAGGYGKSVVRAIEVKRIGVGRYQEESTAPLARRRRRRGDRPKAGAGIRNAELDRGTIADKPGAGWILRMPDCVSNNLRIN